MKHALLISLFFCMACASQPQRGSTTLNQDEASIRQWFEHWIESSVVGDLPLARSLIADDAVFLVPGAGEMGKESFAAASTASDPNIDFKLDCSIQEIEVMGEYAWLRSSIALSMTDKASGSISKLAGHSLSILKRAGKSWVVVRDANTMVALPPAE